LFVTIGERTWMWVVFTCCTYLTKLLESCIWVSFHKIQKILTWDTLSFTKAQKNYHVMSILIHSSLQLPYQSITKPTIYLNGPALLIINIIRPWAHQTDIVMCRLFWLNPWLISLRGCCKPYMHFSSSPKRHLEHDILATLLKRKGLKWLHDVKTKWIFMFSPIKQIPIAYRTLVVKMNL
jgi:hypothetical protein